MKRSSCYLPEEIIVSNILFRLPVKDIAKFKCTSKYLLSLITNPYFRNQFLTQHHTKNYNYDYEIGEDDEEEDILLTTYEKSHGITTSSKYEMNYFSINERTMKPPTLVNYVRDQKNLILQSSCKGLILFNNLYDPNHLYISNPVTNQLVSLPPSKYFRVGWTLVYDACVDTFSVCGISTNGKLLLSFTQGEARWKETSIPKFSNHQTLVHTDPILVNRELVWLTEDDASEDEPYASFYPKLYYICYFNVETRQVTRKHIPASVVAPRPKTDPNRCYFLSQFQGSLCLAIINPFEINFFVLEDRVANQWEGILLISLSCLVFYKPKTFIKNFMAKDTCSFAMRNADSNTTHLADCLKLIVHHDDQLYLCDLKNQQWKQLAGFLNKDKCLALQSMYHSYSLADWERGLLS